MKHLTKVILIVACMFALATASVEAQNLVTVVHGSSSSFYTTVDSAYMASVDGDYIYIPGGSWTMGQVIKKSVNIVGVGANLTSSLATGTTNLSYAGGCGNLCVGSGADNGSITGIRFTSIFYVGYDCNIGNVAVNNYTVSRCRFTTNFYLGAGASLCTNFFGTENIFDALVYGYYAQGAVFTKNFFQASCLYFENGCRFVNNVWITSGQWCLQGVNNCFVNNNICINYPVTYFITGSTNTVLNNNVYNLPLYDIGACVENNGIYSASPIFINETGNSYNPLHDYHIDAASPAHLHGTDGTDCGVYGTNVPFKTNGVPFNPHISQQNVSTTTDNQGQLPVNITVDAQGN